MPPNHLFIVTSDRILKSRFSKLAKFMQSRFLSYFLQVLLDAKTVLFQLESKTDNR